MFWPRTTGHGAFSGLVSGTLAAGFHLALTGPKGAWIHTIHKYNSEMAQNFWAAIWAFSICFLVTVAVSLATRREKSDEELRGLVYQLTPHVDHDEGLAWYAKPWTLAVFVLLFTLGLTFLFW